MALLNWRFSVPLLLTAMSGVAAAADLPVPPSMAPAAAANSSPTPEWTVTIGAEGRAIPAWPGAPQTEYGFTALPLVSIRRAGAPPDFFGARDSVSIDIIDLGMLKLGPAAKLVWKRTASDYAELRGLGDVNYAIQAGGYGELWPVPWLRLRGEVRQGFWGETGLTGDVFLDAVIPFGQFRWSGGPRVTLQSARATNPYFGFTAAQAAAADVTVGQPALPLTGYSAGGGLYSYGAGTQVEYFFSPQWAAHGLFEYERLTGSAANSPLVTLRGSPDQFSFGLGATYSFNIRQFW